MMSSYKNKEADVLSARSVPEQDSSQLTTTTPQGVSEGYSATSVTQRSASSSLTQGPPNVQPSTFGISHTISDRECPQHKWNPAAHRNTTCTCPVTSHSNDETPKDQQARLCR